MPEAVSSNIPVATPFAALLASSAGSQPLSAYRGALSPALLDADGGEMETLLCGAAVHDLGWLRRVAARGEDRLRWLNGMVSNMVTDLSANTGAWNLVLNAQGRIQGELYVWRNGDELLLEIAADQSEKLLAHLDRFIIMDDVELLPLGEESALGLSGPAAMEVLQELGLPAPGEPLTCASASWNGLDVWVARGYQALVPHFELWVNADATGALWTALGAAGAKPVGAAALEALRVAEGIPAYGIDMVERDLPQETAQMRALHFSKGCYQGQEIVERIRSRGNVHRHLRQLELDGPLPEPGAELKFVNAAGEEAAAGAITSVAELALNGTTRRFALGMVRAEAELRSQPLRYEAAAGIGSATVLTAAPVLDAQF